MKLINLNLRLVEFQFMQSYSGGEGLKILKMNMAYFILCTCYQIVIIIVNLIIIIIIIYMQPTASRIQR